jgi:thioredoxin reductase (NADPH)
VLGGETVVLLTQLESISIVEAGGMVMSVDKNKDTPAQVKLLGSRSSATAYAIRDFFGRSAIVFQWIELESHEQATCEASVNGLDDPRLPICIFPDGSRIEAPTLYQVADKLGLIAHPKLKEYDLLIAGGGPAGLSAAVYGASEGLRTVVVERSTPGGQAGSSSKIENYLGFPQGISGAELARRAAEQAAKFGAEILLVKEGIDGVFENGMKIGKFADDSQIVARTAICATGVDYRRLNLPNEERLLGTGVYYGAGVSEAPSCTNEHIFVVGGGNSAGQAALNFSTFARKVTMVVRGKQLGESLSQYLVDKIMTTPNIEVLTRTQVIAIDGDDILRSITLADDSGTEHTVETNRLFVCIGGKPRTEWALGKGIVRDAGGYIVTGPDLLKNGNRPGGWELDRDPYVLETSIPGFFAAGDVRHGSIKRVASAVGEGAMAVQLVHRYLTSG